MCYIRHLAQGLKVGGGHFSLTNLQVSRNTRQQLGRKLTSRTRSNMGGEVAVFLCGLQGLTGVSTSPVTACGGLNACKLADGSKPEGLLAPSPLTPNLKHSRVHLLAWNTADYTYANFNISHSDGRNGKTGVKTQPFYWVVSKKKKELGGDFRCEFVYFFLNLI